MWRWGILAALLALGACGRPADLSKCDDAIKDTLKAPATYKRIDFTGAYQKESPSYYITYDAENSFGVPLRSSITCYLSTDRTSVTI